VLNRISWFLWAVAIVSLIICLLISLSAGQTHLTTALLLVGFMAGVIGFGVDKLRGAL
jgi:surface polysaccharide O-acyltransferase-like enzyme